MSSFKIELNIQELRYKCTYQKSVFLPRIQILGMYTKKQVWLCFSESIIFLHFYSTVLFLFYMLRYFGGVLKCTTKSNGGGGGVKKTKKGGVKKNQP